MKKSILVLSLIIFSISTFVAQNTYVDVFEGPKTILLDGIFKDLNLKNGVAKSAIPVSLPKDAKGFYYRILVLPKKSSMAHCTDLMSTIQQMPSSVSDKQIPNQLTAKKSGRSANFYFLRGNENATGLENYRHFKYFEKFLHQKSFYGYMDNKKLDDFYIGIENGYELKGLKIVLEVVAVM